MAPDRSGSASPVGFLSDVAGDKVMASSDALQSPPDELHLPKKLKRRPPQNSVPQAESQGSPLLIPFEYEQEPIHHLNGNQCGPWSR